MVVMTEAEVLNLEKERIEIMQISGERMLAYFTFAHLQHERLRVASAIFCKAAVNTVRLLDVGPERTVALRKLLEGKDAAVRAAL